MSTEPVEKSTAPSTTWRTVDIVVASVIGVALGFVFWIWNLLYSVAATLTAPIFPPAWAVIYGMWLVTGVLSGLIIRKRGAAVLTSIAAASVSAILGVQWGWEVVVSGALQGLGAELVFLAFGYRRWGMGVAVLAAVASALYPAVRDNIVSNVTWPLSYQLSYAAIVIASSAVIAGVGSRLLTTSLAKAGALAPFPSAKG
ncbi:ECF transporter S component [Nocardiopsis ansamitocini]|uniref:Energy-coupling factor transport system substrate-specific component n=1 Tax=Nocardiopsis ansamitocini TaxID=1670832 RepID=A0A9W6P3V3_9ACTN|nr:ECF transporter S component [Nocardiopsis ansamitocini]GLU46676.1 hypothetical protein Nans01_10270 [Nocardiopsis ansamitocini]